MYKERVQIPYSFEELCIIQFDFVNEVDSNWHGKAMKLAMFS